MMTIDKLSSQIIQALDRLKNGGDVLIVTSNDPVVVGQAEAAIEALEKAISIVAGAVVDYKSDQFDALRDNRPLGNLEKRQAINWIRSLTVEELMKELK